MAISSKDIETLWKRYSSEAVNRGVSVAQFFESNGIPYHVFEKWYKKKFTQSAVVNCVVKETQDVASQPSKDNIAETDAAVGAAEAKAWLKPLVTVIRSTRRQSILSCVSIW